MIAFIQFNGDFRTPIKDIIMLLYMTFKTLHSKEAIVEEKR